MSFNKFIRSGDQIELYGYEHDRLVSDKPRGRRGHKKDLGIDPDTLQLQNFTRRKDNAQRSSMNFKRVVLSNLVTEENPLLITITYKKNITSLSESAKFFHLFITNLRYRYGKEFKYIAVPEFQKRGAVHYHALVWGLPSQILLAECLKGYYENKSPTLTKIHGQGFVFCKATDGHAKLSSYLAKYMVKAINDPRLFNTKAYFSSQNILRPIVSSGFPLWWFFEEYGIDESSSLKDNSYLTHWLGKGRYRLFKIPSSL